MRSKTAFSLIELSIVILVIAILIAGVTQSSIIINTSRLTNAQTITRSSSVASIPNLVLWLETTLDGSLTNAAGDTSVQDSDSISSWNDLNPQSATKINLTQSTSSARPTYKTGKIGKLPSVYFDGTDNLESAIAAIPAAAKQYTIILVWQAASSSGTQVIFHQRSNASNCSGGEFAGIYIDSTPAIKTWGCGSTSTDYNTTASYSVNTPYSSFYKVDNNQANNVTAYINGTTYGPTSKSLVNLAANYVAAGYAGVSPYYYYTGYISEIIVYAKALKSDEINDIRSYLTKKYGFNA